MPQTPLHTTESKPTQWCDHSEANNGSNNAQQTNNNWQYRQHWQHLFEQITKTRIRIRIWIQIWMRKPTRMLNGMRMGIKHRSNFRSLF